MQMIEDFVYFIKRELDRRQQSDRKFTITAFGREVGMSSQMLQGILRKQSGISPKFAEKLSPHLNLTAAENELFTLLVQSRHARSKHLREFAQKRLDKIWQNTLSSEGKELSSALYYLAAYALVDVHDFQPVMSWISSRLLVSEEICRQIYEAFFAEGFLIKDLAGKWKKPADIFLPDVFSEKGKTFYKNLFFRPGRCV